MYAVLTTFYNGDSVSFADEAISSIVNQSVGFDHINIYLHVDGELDEEHEAYFIKNQGLFYKVIRSSNNIGLAKGLNKLISELGDEEFVFRMDLDDISSPDRFERQSHFLEENASLSLVGCWSEEIDENGVREYKKKYPISNESIKAAICRAMPILHPTFCFRGKVLKNLKVRYPNYYLTEDLGFLFEFIKLGYKVGNCPEYLFYWRKTQSFYKRRNLRRSFTELKVYRQICKEYGSNKYDFIYPYFRFVFRMMPSFLVKYIYNSDFRNKLTN